MLFAREGARILAADINPEAAAETAGIIESEGGECRTFTADVSLGDDVVAMTQACLENFGRIDVLVNVVGIALQGGVVDVSEADWDRVSAVNLRSVYLTCKHVLPVMESQGSGSIVNLSSIAAHRWTGIPYATYYATKGAIIPLSRSIALEYAPKGIRCNTVSPGLMNTPMVIGGLAAALRWRRRADGRRTRCPVPHRQDGRRLGRRLRLALPRL